MQEQRGAMGSFSETLGFEHGSTSSDNHSPSNRLPDYMSLNPATQEGENISMWPVSEPSSRSGPSQSTQGHNGSSSSSFSDPFGPSSELEPRQVSRKRKAVELTIGQSSSGVGSSNMFQHTVAEEPISDPTIPRLGLSIGQQIDPLPANNTNRASDVSVLRLNLPTENSSSHQGQPVLQPVLRVPALRRNFQSTSRWSRSTTSRATRSPTRVMSSDRTEPELDSISDHLLFTPPTGNGVAIGSQPGPSSGSSPSHHSRRLSAFLRRSLLSASDLEGGEGQNGNIFSRLPPALSGSSSSSQDVGVPPGHHHAPLSRSSLLLGRQLEGVFAFPHHSRTVTPGSEGRGRLVSEIRNVLDLMRRGEPLRFEDLMILDQSVFYGVADMHDRHRDMRLDIDNMSYEELLALEERIGNVSTGLTEETISKHIKQKQHVVETGQPDAEPCCICQEEYKDGEDLGALDCGHDFHYGCIKQWLQQKNLCPICKSTGFAAT